MQTLDCPIRVPSDVLEALGEFTGHFWSDSLALEPFICEAIRNYMRPAPAAQTQPASASEAGYQWKQLFLPEGTRLRASFGGHSYFAQVQGDAIKYGEDAISPSRFANLQGSGNRNAWKAIWLRLPGSDEWLLADVCRSARKAATARLLGGGVQAERAPQAPCEAPPSRITVKKPKKSPGEFPGFRLHSGDEVAQALMPPAAGGAARRRSVAPTACPFSSCS
jgi:hypothetical protein